jgi:NADH dehydrogenase FAD-containing subunit
MWDAYSINERLTLSNTFFKRRRAFPPRPEETRLPSLRWVKPARGNRLTVQSDCSVAEHPNIFAIGDIAGFIQVDGTGLPGLAPVAKQQGAYVGKLIAKRLEGF